MEEKCSEGLENSFTEVARSFTQAAEAMRQDFSSSCLSLNSNEKILLPGAYLFVCMRVGVLARILAGDSSSTWLRIVDYIWSIEKVE